MKKSSSRSRAAVRRAGFEINRKVKKTYLLAIVLTFGIITAVAGNRLLTGLAAGPVQESADGQISLSAQKQIQALVAEKMSRTPAQRKIDSQLIYAAKMSRGESIAADVPTLAVSVESEGNRVVVDITGTINDSLLQLLSANGAKILVSTPDYGTVRAEVGLDRLESIAESPDVRYIQSKQEAMTSRRPVGMPTMGMTGRGRGDFAVRAARVRENLRKALTAMGQDDVPGSPGAGTNVGARESQGVITHRVDVARSRFGVDGTGVKIGVLSDGVINLSFAQASGDVPLDVTVLPGQAGSGDEGTAMLEIVHDMAPGAKLFFATAFGSISSFAGNIQKLRQAGCDIIVDDVFYFVEAPFQDGQTIPTNTNGGIVTQAVNDVTADGALYFSSAGNEGNLNDGTSGVFEGDFVNGGTIAIIGGAGAGPVHDFDPGAGVSQFDRITLGSGNPITLAWSDVLGGSANDYDLYILNAAGTALVAASTGSQSGTQDPFEIVGGGANVTNNRIVVAKFSGADRFLHVNTFRGRLLFATDGQTHGHSAAANAYSVAATPVVGPFPQPFNSTNQVETFESDGPRRLFFQPNGTAYTPGNFSSTGGTVRQKPDITAADGGVVSGAGGFPNPFFGTSAAAPHAAAIVALLKQARPLLTPAQIRTAVLSSAIDIEAPGVDRDSGVGIIMADTMIQNAGGTPVEIELVSATATETAGNGNGVVEPGEAGALSIVLRNNTAGILTNVSAAIISNTTGVAIVPPGTSDYPNISVGDVRTNSTPFQFLVSSTVPFPSTISFTLTVNATGASGPKVFSFNVSLRRTVSFDTVLDATAPSGGVGFTATTGSQTGRLVRTAFGSNSSCGIVKSNPGVNAADANVLHRYDAYTFQNNTANPICITVTLTTSAAQAGLLQSVAYAPTFDPTQVNVNYLGDIAGNQTNVGTRIYSFIVPANTTFVVVVNEVTGGSGAVPYTLTVEGLPAAVVPTVNQPPVNTVPATQSVIQNSQLVFSTANGNAISIADPDAGSAPVQQTLTATNGTLTLGSTAGLSFTVGNGTNNSTMTYTGTIAAINAALQGLTYRPNSNFTGAATLTVNTNDQGFLGSGGAKSDTDVVTINVNAGSAFSFSAASYFVGESDGATVITVTRNGDLSTAASVNYATSNGTATDRSDYGAAFGTLQFAVGQFSTTLVVLINEDSLVEGNETFNLTLSNPQGTSVALGLQPTAVVTIVDNATEPATNAIDDTTNFVVQHYHDFLNREPDAAGLAFWVNNIDSCGANAACREVRRIDTSASFFLSIEFQQSGFLAYRTYAAAFGPTRIGSTVPLTLQEFLTDTQQLGNGVIIGNAGAEAQLEANKVAYFNQFVTRPEFVTKYPAALTNEQYVDNLLASAGLSPSQVRLFVVNMTNGQEVPPANPTTSTGGARPASFGTARLRFNDAQTAMTFSATINNIDVGNAQTPGDTNDNLIAAHIHAGPTVTPTTNGPVVWGFFGAPFNDNNPNDQVVTPFSSGVGGNFSGKWDAPEGNATTLAAQLSNLREGRAYVNFHTVQFGGGEIRGNILPATAFRDALVAGLNAGTETRATVLRKVAEAEELSLKEFNRAFVLMQYFGYLRRNPNDAPDGDFSGYNFWLNKLNTFNGDFRGAEMVKAFISSFEYRKRFGLN